MNKGEMNDVRRRLKVAAETRLERSRDDVLAVLDYLDTREPLTCAPAPCAFEPIGSRFHDHPTMGTFLLHQVERCTACGDRRNPQEVPSTVNWPALSPLALPRVFMQLDGVQRFYCPCGVSHERGPVNGARAFRCLACGETHNVPEEHVYRERAEGVDRAPDA